jgi:hypothetical protein
MSQKDTTTADHGATVPATVATVGGGSVRGDSVEGGATPHPTSVARAETTTRAAAATVATLGRPPGSWPHPEADHEAGAIGLLGDGSQATAPEADDGGRPRTPPRSQTMVLSGGGAANDRQAMACPIPDGADDVPIV